MLKNVETHLKNRLRGVPKLHFWTPQALYGAIFLLLIVTLSACNAFKRAEPERPVAAEADSSGSGATLDLPLPTADVDQSSTGTSNISQDDVAAENGQGEIGPKIGEISFALGVTDDYEPIEPNLFFTTGITEVHAIFDYSGMSPDDTWERVWSLNDKEVARIAEAWAGPKIGVFDDFINNSGRPLPAGDWVLEIYVGGELRTLGVFIIEDAQ